MDKNKLIPGRKYLHRKTHMIDNRIIKAQRWLKCERITDTGVIFSRDFEPGIELTDKEIREEIME